MRARWSNGRRESARETTLRPRGTRALADVTEESEVEDGKLPAGNKYLCVVLEKVLHIPSFLIRNSSGYVVNGGFRN